MWTKLLRQHFLNFNAYMNLMDTLLKFWFSSFGMGLGFCIAYKLTGDTNTGGWSRNFEQQGLKLKKGSN